MDRAITAATAGPTLAGLVMRYVDPQWTWFVTGVIGVLAAGVSILLRGRMGQSTETAAGSASRDLRSQRGAARHA